MTFQWKQLINDPNVYIHGLFLSELLLKTALNENCSQPLLIQMTDVWTTRKDAIWCCLKWHASTATPNEKGAWQPFAVKHSYEWHWHDAWCICQQERQPVSGWHQLQFSTLMNWRLHVIYVDKDKRMRTPSNQDMVVRLLRWSAKWD
jgi:hypothetical protein